MEKKIALLLTGCGHLDGAEIRESVLSILAIDEISKRYGLKLEIEYFSLNQNIYSVVDHITGKEEGDSKRNMLVESGRIARGDVKDLKTFIPEKYIALIIPGGFGVAKIFSNFFQKGFDGVVNPLVNKVIVSMHELKRPIGAICIAPVLLALCLREYHPLITIGNDQDLIKGLGQMNVRHKSALASEIVLDEKNNLITTPAYMLETEGIAAIYQGISKLVNKIFELSQFSNKLYE